MNLQLDTNVARVYLFSAAMVCLVNCFKNEYIFEVKSLYFLLGLKCRFTFYFFT